MTDWNHSTPLATAGVFAQAMIPLRVEGADPTNPALDTFEQVAVATVIAGLAGSTTAPAVSVDLFANLGAVSLPATQTAFIAGGHIIGGLGGGTYVADSLATPSLASRCPRFCAADGTGRLFRLVPTNGAVAISQAGALGGTNNDQPAVQACIDYCKAINARILLFDFETVSIFNTVRTSNAGQNTTDAWAQDGQSIWITAPIKFLGLPTPTRIKMLSVTGTSLETGWQNVNGNVWRGSGINLVGGSQGLPNANNLTFFAMENIWLDGGCAYTGVRTAVTITSPDGPDLTNKGIRLQNTQCDAITLINCRIDGFKGETCYIAGQTETLQFYDHVKISGSNQSAFNPSDGQVRATDCEFGNSFGAMECLGRTGSVFLNCLFYDSSQASATGGPANGLLYNYGFPTRDLTKSPPWLDLINCEFRNIGQVLVGNYIRMQKFRSSDCQFVLDTALTIGLLTSTYLDGDYTLDQRSVSPLIRVAGPPTLTTAVPVQPGSPPSGANTSPTSDVHVRVNVHRTVNAMTNNYSASVYSYDGYFDQNSCSLHIGEADGVATSFQAGTVGSCPLLTMEGPSSSHLIGGGRPFAVHAVTIPPTATSYAVAVDSPRMSLYYGGTATTIAVTIAAPFTAPFGHSSGQTCKIFWDGYTTPGTILSFARNGAGLRLNSNCALAVSGDWLEVEFNPNTALWHEIGRGVYLP